MKNNFKTNNIEYNHISIEYIDKDFSARTYETCYLDTIVNNINTLCKFVDTEELQWAIGNPYVKKSISINLNTYEYLNNYTILHNNYTCEDNRMQLIRKYMGYDLEIDFNLQDNQYIFNIKYDRNPVVGFFTQR